MTTGLHHSSGTLLVTGALGNVARMVIPHLQNHFPLRLIDRKDGEVGGIPVQKVDILNFARLHEVVDGCRGVVHFAVARDEAPPNTSLSEARECFHQNMLQVNVRGSYHIFESALQNRVERVIFISSLAVVLGDGQVGRLDPDEPARPVDLYACTKLFGEHLAFIYWHEHKLRSYVLRLGQPYPLGLEKEVQWKQDPYTASLLVTGRDISAAIRATMETKDVSYGIYNVVSPSSHALVDYSKGREIGFVPSDPWEAGEGAGSDGDGVGLPARSPAATIC